MKKKVKIALLFSLVLMIICSAFVASSAAEPGVFYTITSKDGSVKSYNTPIDFVANAINANDGDTITLCQDIEIKSGMKIISTESEPRTINFDLAGHGLYAKAKITFFDVGNYTTVNIYSSKEKAFIYDMDEDNSNIGGGCMFAAGKNARINFGTMLVGENLYPGSNISTFFSSLVNTQKSGTSGVYINGGTHFANISDWKAFVCLRDGDGDIYIKNADLIALKNPYFLYTDSESRGTLYLENCNMIRADGVVKPLFYQSDGKTVLKNCVSNCILTVGDTYSKNTVTLEGKNIFNSEGAPNNVITGLEDVVFAKVNYDITFMNGEKSIWYFESNGSLRELVLYMPEIKHSGVVAKKENTIEYTWDNGNDKVTEIWYEGEEPVFPLQLPNNKAQEGKYKPHWTKTEDGRCITYTGGLALDFAIKTSVEYNGYVCMNIYIPA